MIDNKNKSLQSGVTKSVVIPSSRFPMKRVIIGVVILIVFIIVCVIFWKIKYKNNQITEQQAAPQVLLSESYQKINTSNMNPEQKSEQLLYLGNAYYSEGNFTEALKSYQQAESQSEKYNQLIYKGIIRAAEKLNDTALKDEYEKKLIILTTPELEKTGSVDSLWILAQNYEKSGDKAKSLQYYQDFLSKAKFEDAALPVENTYATFVKTDIEAKIQQLKKDLGQ